MSSLISTLLLSSVVLLSLFTPSFSQILTNVTGTATCGFQTFQMNVANTGYIMMSGSMTMNLTALSSTIPNTPGFTGQSFYSYPILSISGTREYFIVGSDGSPNMTFNNITGIGANRTIYMTFNPAFDPSGFPTDVGYAYRFDYTGITILTNSTTLPSLRFAEVLTSGGSPYSELELNLTVWQGASFTFNSCTQNYTFIASAVTTANAVGDPSFTGFRGQSYQVHGMDNTVYNVITDRFIQLNALFVFLTSGQCPIVGGQRLTNCWSHPGSYFGALALQTATGHRVHMEAGSAKEGLLLTVDDSPLTGTVTLPGLSVTRVNTHKAMIEAGLYRFTVENSDHFINLVEVDVTDWVLLRKDVQSHGLLGQTWQSHKGKNAVEGEVDDYAEGDNDLFGSKFLYNRFGL